VVVVFRKFLTAYPTPLVVATPTEMET